MDFPEKDLIDVLLALKKAVSKQIKVASFGKVQSIDTTNKLLKVKLFPIIETEQEKTVDVRYLNDDTDDTIVGTIVLVLFLDKDFSNNLRLQERGQDVVKKVSPDSDFHSESYAVAIKTF